MRRIALSMVLMGLLPALAASARAANQQDEKELGTVVVTATRIRQPLSSVTSSISVVSDQDIADRQSPSVVDALRDVPGVDVSQSGSPGSAASVFVRGAESDQTLILFDGVEVNSPTLGGFNFGNISTDGVGRIEVLRGAGGTLYGSEAMGGVVNVITQKGEGPPHFTLSSAGGNIGTSSNLASFAGQSGIVSYAGSLGYLTTAGYQPVNDDFSNLTSSARIDVTPIEHGTLHAFWRSADSSLGLPNTDISNGYGDFLDPNARERDEFYLGKLEWQHSPLPRLTYDVSEAYTRTVNTFSDFPDPQALASPNFDPSYFLTHFRVPNEIYLSNGQLNYSEGGMGITTAGAEFKEQTGKLESIYYMTTPPDRFSRRRYNIAGYLQQQIFLLGDRLVGVGGFRVDANQDFGREVSASWSVGYREDWGAGGRWDTHVKGSYAEGFRAPTFNELYYPNSGNPNLTAETSSEYDGGVEQHLGLRWLAVTGTFFTRRTKNLITFVPNAQCPGAPAGEPFVPCNLGLTDVRGVETEIDVGPWEGFVLRGTYTYLDFDVAGGQKLARRPHNRMGTTLTYTRANLVREDDQLTANVNVVFVGARTDYDPLAFNSNATNPAYTRTDLALRYDVPVPGHSAYRVGGFARIQNLFDRNYQEVLGYPSPPINVLAGGQLTF